MARKLKDKPYTSNYPPLASWLRDHEARCNWQLPLGGTPADEDNEAEPYAYVESWILPNGRECIVVVQAMGHGWNIYTPCASGKVADTLADADARLGIKS